MKKLLCIFCLFLSLAALAGNSDKDKSGSKVVAGKVTDIYGEAVSGAKITVAETGEVVYADLEGNFKLTVKTDKAYSISVNTIGYAPLEIKSTFLTGFSGISLKPL